MNRKNSTSFHENFYECECPHLHRGLPFREQFEKAVLHDILQKFPSNTHHHLTYVSQGPGGFLNDIKIISHLIRANYKEVTLVFIEPLYEKNKDILYACLAVKNWCKDQSTHESSLIPYFYRTMQEYAHACERDLVRKGDIFITIDPDDKKTTPNFGSHYFRKKFSEIFKAIMYPKNTFYYLYFQQCETYNYRHMLIGQLISENCDHIIKLHHFYGEESLYEHSHNYVFFNNKPVYPYNAEKEMVQIGKKILRNPQLSSLL